MTGIIYKEGCEGKNTLENVEGIEIELLNGQKVLIYPKYSEEMLLDMKDRDRWHDEGVYFLASNQIKREKSQRGEKRKDNCDKSIRIFNI